MSSDDSATYSDAQSGYTPSGDKSPISSVDSSSGTDAPETPKPRPEQSFRLAYASDVSSSSIFRRSESLYLVLLFALIAILLPAFFFYASNPSKSPVKDTSDSAESRKSPLTALLAYIPALPTLIRLSFSALYTLFRPPIALLSVLRALLAPLFIAFNVMFQVTVVMPARIITELVQFFYPLYVFCGTACLLGGVVGLGGKIFIEVGRFVLSSVQMMDETNVQLRRVGGKGEHL